MSRRDQITMSEAEALAFLDEERTLVCATNGVRGWPHLMPLWYVVRDGTVWAWTFAKSQKVKNIERDPRVTIQVEAGETYPELRGVMLECEVRLHHDVEDVTALGLEIFQRYTPPKDGAAPDALTVDAVRKQASKRVGLEFVEVRRATWDHRKLAAGVY
ncbi:MAG: pyridoxamine 5'-phosphate oxidase family protein [Solirubrobacteraceae bacterium]|nr:pyridoxamine 5'-phosphate oxidase family protein [Solirubrobacteraceae bacterium]